MKNLTSISRPLKFFCLMISLSISAASANAEVVEIENERFGLHPSLKIDVYYPEQETDQPRPVLTIIGGAIAGDSDAGWTREDYAELARAFAREGYAVFVAGYRPLSDIQWPQGTEEMRDIAGWVRANLQRVGAAQPNMMMQDGVGMSVIGFGPGARHLISYLLFEPSHMGRGATGISSAVLIDAFSGTHSISDLEAYNLNFSGVDPASLASSYEGLVPPILLVNSGGATELERAAMDELRLAICSNQETCPEVLDAQPTGRQSANAALMDKTIALGSAARMFFAGSNTGE